MSSDSFDDVTIQAFSQHLRLPELEDQTLGFTPTDPGQPPSHMPESQAAPHFSLALL